MKHIAILVLSLLFATTAANAKEGFDAVRCGGDIAQALTGKHMPEGTVASLESRYKSIGLKDLGADEISDQLSSISWMICGKEYDMLVDRDNLVRDVIVVPPHSRRAPEYSGAGCEMEGKPFASLVIAVLDNPAAASAKRYLPGDKTPLAAKSAWKIDEAHAKFAALDAKGLRCPRGGIVTADGGS